MTAKKDQKYRVKLQQQLKKKYRFATGGSGQRFFLAFALRQLRAREFSRRGTCRKATKKSSGGWTITVSSQAAGTFLRDGRTMEEEKVEEDGSVIDMKYNFSSNEEDSRLAILSDSSCPLTMELAKLDELDKQQLPSTCDQLLNASIEGIPLPAVVCSLLIANHFDQSSCIAVALSGAFREFSSAYTSSRKRKGLVINEQCFYFTPTTFSLFIDEHITLQQSITVLNLNNLYWLPAQLLERTIRKMTNVETLSIKGTRVCTVRQVGTILESCPNIKSLDFTFTAKTEKDIEDGLKKENISTDSFTKWFQRLTTLKLSTTAAPYPNDPWWLLLKLLRYCRDCTNLAIEVTYPDMSQRFSPFLLIHTEEEWHQLKWMLLLESLQLTKLGPLLDESVSHRVTSPLLNDILCNRLFPYTATPIVPARPMKCLWIQDFLIYSTNGGFDPLKYLSPQCLTSFKTSNVLFIEPPEDDDVDDDDDYEVDDNTLFGRFHIVENLGGMDNLRFNYPLSSLKTLKYASGIALDDELFYKFCEVHAELEHLSTLPIHKIHYPQSKKLFNLTKLKSFSCKRPISKEFVEAMAEAYQNLEILKLTTYNIYSGNSVLSALCFPKLTSLSLSNFRLGHGSFLLKFVENSPNIHTLYLETASLEPTHFLANLESFFCQATKLRNFRLKWNHRDAKYPTLTLSLIKAILKKSPRLERLVLIDGGSENLPSYSYLPGLDDSLVYFAANMKHLTCYCLTFNQMDVDLMKGIKNRVEEEVVTERPSLWFHLSRQLPQADPNVPSIHYQQIVESPSFDMPRF